MVPAAEPRQQAPNSKLQAPKKHQVPNTKHQAPNSREAPSSKRGPRFGAWNLGFLWCLELGFWCFDSGISLELGVCDLLFGSLTSSPRCAGRGYSGRWVVHPSISSVRRGGHLTSSFRPAASINGCSSVISRAKPSSESCCAPSLR